MSGKWTFDGGSMPIQIMSFGFRHGDPPNTNQDFLVIDIRSKFGRNPYHDKKLRYLRGIDKEVQEDIRKTPDFWEKYEDLREDVKDFSGIICLGCTGRHHRSVYLAELLSKDFGCPVEHRDIDKK